MVAGKMERGDILEAEHQDFDGLESRLRNKEESRAIPRFLDRQLGGFAELEKMDGRGTVKFWACPIVSKRHLQCLWDMQVETLSRRWRHRIWLLGRCWATGTCGHQHQQTDTIFKNGHGWCHRGGVQGVGGLQTCS